MSALSGNRRKASLQDPLGLVFSTALALEICQVDVGGQEGRTELARLLVFARGRVEIAELRVQDSEIHVGRGPVRIDGLRALVVGERAVEPGSRSGIRETRSHRSQYARGLDSDGSHGILEQSLDGGPAVLGRKGLGRADRCHPQQRIRIGESCQDGGQRLA